MKQIPAPLYKKILATAFVGGGCMLFGLIYFIAVRDSVLLILSIAVFANCAWRAFSFYRIAIKKAFDVVEGTCVSVRSKLVGKLKTIRIMDDAGIETTFKLAKNCKLNIGDRYRLYFDKRNQYTTGSNFFDAALSTGNFLGYELLPEKEEIVVDSSNED